jgi:hypothetical protein
LGLFSFFLKDIALTATGATDMEVERLTKRVDTSAVAVFSALSIVGLAKNLQSPISLHEYLLSYCDPKANFEGKLTFPPGI